MSADAAAAALPAVEADLWDPLRRELDLWAEGGLRARLWLRDDDATDVTPALDTLVALAADFGVPVVLAVVPAAATEALARRLEDASAVQPAVHGYAHVNHAPPHEKKQELGLHRPRGAVLQELAVGHEKLRHLFGGRLLPVLVPPWNRIAPEFIPDLPALGFRALSTFGRRRRAVVAELAEINTHLDIIDCTRGRTCRDPRELIGRFAGLLAGSRAQGGAPVGILTHHLVHDPAAWAFLHALFKVTTEHQAVQWISGVALLEM